MPAKKPTRSAPALPVFAGKPAPTTTCAQSPLCVHPRSGVGAGLPANTVAAATVNDEWRLASRPGLFAAINHLIRPSFSALSTAEKLDRQQCI